MLIKSDFEVAQPVDKVWKFFDDIPQVAACLPGAELTDDLGDDKYLGKVAIRMGPVKLQFAGTAEIIERDDAAKRIVVDAAGADEKGRGQASMMVTANLVPTPSGTKVDVLQDLQLSGAAAQYGRGMISDVTADPDARLRDQHAEPDRGDRAGSDRRTRSPAPSRPAASPSRMRAARLALSRVLRRFFAPYQPSQLRRATWCCGGSATSILLVAVVPVLVALLNRVLAALERIRGASDDILAGGWS